MKPLKILHVASHNAIKAGGAIQMMRLALGLKQRGHDVYCAFNIKTKDTIAGLGTFDPLREAGIRVFSFPMQRIYKYNGMLKFRRFLHANAFNVVHCHRFRALKFVYRASFGMKIPALLGNRVISYRVPPSWARIYGKQKVDNIVVNAGIIKKILISTGKVRPEKIEIVYNGVELDKFHPGVDGGSIRKQFGIDKSIPLFGMIANFVRKKSHYILFEAAEKVLKEMPQAKFLLVGGGDYKRYEREMIEKDFGSNFIFTGFRTDIPQIIASLDFSVISSKEGEGQTVSLVESMAMAKPVISTEVGGNPEFAQDKKTGLLVPVGDAGRFAEAMLYLLRNRKEAEEMGKRAYEFVRDKIDNKKITLQFEKIYYDILKKSNP
jgi:glycosyltransferase involved in cell wall biosynthesis